MIRIEDAQGAHSAVRGWRLLTRLFLLPVVLFSAALIPGLNGFLFSGHGGPGWLLLPFCFPVLVFNMWRHVYRNGYRIRAVAVVLVYLVATYPIASIAERRITEAIGLEMADHPIYRVATFPVGLVLPNPSWCEAAASK